MSQPASKVVHHARRDSIHVEDAVVVFHRALAGEQFVLRLQAPKCAAHAKPASFIHLQCDTVLAMRRPFSIMCCSADQGWIEILYKIVGQGTKLLAAQPVGAELNLMGPIGNSFKIDPSHGRFLLLGGGVGIPPIIFLSEYLHKGYQLEPVVLMGSEVPFPFSARPSQILLPGIPDGVIAAMPLLEDWGIASRLSSLQGFPGCYEGYVSELARTWIESLNTSTRNVLQVFACGPNAMLKAVAKLVQLHDLPCQLAVEEFMACGVGGCAGCTIPVNIADGIAMKRVCVDGPVFDARAVYCDISARAQN